jgi:O-acetyl-ADP-ribose deacetylase (regulator of RNase III)
VPFERGSHGWAEIAFAVCCLALGHHARKATMLVVGRIELVEGNITQQEVDAIVNAANSSLMGGGGVDGAIHRAGGPAILEECTEIRRSRFPEGLPTGQAVATTAGNLPARWVIHTVGPVYSRSEDRSALLASCHTESLRVADELGATTVAFPAISTGIYGYPLGEAAEVAVGAVRGAATEVEEVRFVLFGRKAFEAFERALGA